jgi:nitrogen fixation NifU-like protein
MSEPKDLKKFALALQEQILEQARREYSEAVIDRWINPRNMGQMENPDGYGKVTGTCGDTIEIFLRMKDDKISRCTYLTDGCGATISCACMATELARGKTFIEALAVINAQKIIQELGGLPEGNVHCAQLAAESLRHALADYLHQKKTPWKSAYRKT